ncbi:MAG: tripartite tricarboxylate transporter substrate binding protein [Betaproteobacteria bacterium]|nr:tripartite tricarboxylate transporter substrate binding protein [Betaproteobacteria bacterium]
MKKFCITLIFAAGLVLAGAAGAADFPTKPVRLVVPFPPGGTLDVVGRMLARQLQEIWGQPVIVENKGGAGSAIGVDSVAKSSPDGYSMVLNAATPMVTVIHLQKVPYDFERDLVPVAQTSAISYALGVSSRIGVKSVKELVDLTRKNPGKLNYGSGGTGSGMHMYMELAKHAANMEITHIPYKGNGPAMQALLGGEVDVIFDTVLAIIPMAKAGKLIPLMVSSAKPSPLLPGVPTMDSLYPGSSMDGWHGVFTTGGTPKDVVNKLAEGVRKAVLSPEMANRLRELGFEPTGLDAERFGQIVRRDGARWEKIIRERNIRPN